MKILLYLATYRANPETIYTVTHLEHPADIALDVCYSIDNPYTEAVNRNILHQYQKAQRMAAGYDYILTVEDDMILPSDALINMLDTADKYKADIVYGVYHFRRLSMMINVTDPKTGVSIDAKRHAKYKAARAIVDCGGLGWGCTLIRADVFMSATLESRNGSGTDSDTHFAEWARKNNLTMKADWRVLCGHKRADGSVLHVGDKPDAPRIVGTPHRFPVRVRALVSFGGRDETGVVFVIREGEEGMIDNELAETLKGAGQLVILEESKK